MINQSSENLLKIIIGGFNKEHTPNDIKNAPFISIKKNDIDKVLANDISNLLNDLKHAKLVSNNSYGTYSGITVCLTQEGYNYFNNLKKSSGAALIQINNNCNVQNINGDKNIATQNYNNNEIKDAIDALLKEDLYDELKTVLNEIKSEINNGKSDKEKWLKRLNTCASIATLAPYAPIIWEKIGRLANVVLV